MSQDALIKELQEKYPDFYTYLMNRPVNRDVITPERTAEVLAAMKRGNDTCCACQHPGAALQCEACKVVRYCDRECQQLDFEKHRDLCAAGRIAFQMIKLQQQSGHLDE